MKLNDELKSIIARLELIKNRIPIIAEQLKVRGNYKNYEVRLAWECLRVVITTKELCSWYEKYNCNDDHITTLAKKALKAVYTLH